MSTLALQIDGHSLPCPEFPGRGPVLLGLQHGTDVIDMVPVAAGRAAFSLSLRVVPDAEGGLDYRGPFVHGRRGERFLYLSWGSPGADGGFEMFRRIKLILPSLPPEQVTAALTGHALLRVTLALSDTHGQPLAASVRPPRAVWTFSPTDGAPVAAATG